MPITFQSLVENDYLYAVTEGSVSSIPEMVEYIEELHEEAARAGVSKLLVDETKFHLHIRFDELMDVDGIGRKLGWSEKELTVAIVSSDMNHPLFRHTFELMDGIRVFSDKEEAQRWLAEA